MKAYKGIRPKKKKKLDGKRCIRINKRLQEDFLVKLRDKLEDEHIKKYTFIVKGSKMYTAGVFWSEKNKRKYVFRSTYEFAYFYQLEQDPKVTAYVVEPFEVPYYDPKYKRQGIYKPDVLVSYSDGHKRLLEIKPKRKLRMKDVRAKAEGAKNFLKQHYPDVTYDFITEEIIFQHPGDYMKLLGRIDPARHKKRLESKERKKENIKIIEDKKELDYVKQRLPQQLKYAPFILV